VIKGVPVAVTVLVLLTVTEMLDDVVEFPAESVAIAVTV
jgi:hypothetical protein